MKKLIAYFLFISIIFCLSACKKENGNESQLSAIFSSLPELTSPIVSDMVLSSIAPSNGPLITVLKYKKDTLIQSSKLFIQIISNDFAFGVEGYYSAVFAHKNHIDKVCFCRLLFLQDNITTDQMDLRNFAFKLDKDQANVYFRVERWTTADSEDYWDGKNFTGQIIYFKYSLITDELFDEMGQKVNLD